MNTHSGTGFCRTNTRQCGPEHSGKWCVQIRCVLHGRTPEGVRRKNKMAQLSVDRSHIQPRKLPFELRRVGSIRRLGQNLHPFQRHEKSYNVIAAHHVLLLFVRRRMRLGNILRVVGLLQETWARVGRWLQLRSGIPTNHFKYMYSSMVNRRILRNFIIILIRRTTVR